MAFNSTNQTFMVLGATGNVGSTLTKALSTNCPSARILAGVRNVSSTEATMLHSLNVSLVPADMSRPETLNTAIPRGIDCVFINTPGDQNRTAYAINAIDACCRSQVCHIALMSVICAQQRGTIFGDQFLPIEERLKACGIPYTIFECPMFTDNFLFHNTTLFKEGKVYGPARPDARFPTIAVNDIAECAWRVMTNCRAHVNRTYRLTSPPYTCNGMATALGNASGKKVVYVQATYDQTREVFMSMGYPEWQANGILELWRDIDTGAIYAHAYSVDYQQICGHEPMTIEQWAQAYKSCFKAPMQTDALMAAACAVRGNMATQGQQNTPAGPGSVMGMGSVMGTRTGCLPNAGMPGAGMSGTHPVVAGTDDGLSPAERAAQSWTRGNTAGGLAGVGLPAGYNAAGTNASGAPMAGQNAGSDVAGEQAGKTMMGNFHTGPAGNPNAGTNPTMARPSGQNV